MFNPEFPFWSPAEHKSNAREMLQHHARIPGVTWLLVQWLLQNQMFKRWRCYLIIPTFLQTRPCAETGLEIIFQFFCQIQNISLSRFGKIVNYNLDSSSDGCSWSMGFKTHVWHYCFKSHCQTRLLAAGVFINWVNPKNSLSLPHSCGREAATIRFRTPKTYSKPLHLV